MDEITIYGIAFVLYLSLCTLTAVMARKTMVGFWGFLFLSILITPLLPLLSMFLMRKPPPSTT